MERADADAMKEFRGEIRSQTELKNKFLRSIGPQMYRNSSDTSEGYWLGPCISSSMNIQNVDYMCLTTLQRNQLCKFDNLTVKYLQIYGDYEDEGARFHQLHLESPCFKKIETLEFAFCFLQGSAEEFEDMVCSYGSNIERVTLAFENTNNSEKVCELFSCYTASLDTKLTLRSFPRSRYSGSPL